VVGVDSGTSESTRRTSNGRKSGDRGIRDAWKAWPARPSQYFGCVFVGTQPIEANGKARRAERILWLCNFRGEARRAESTSPFCGVWPKTPNSIPCSLAIGVSKGNSTSYCCRLSSFKSQLPANLLVRLYCAPILCAIARKSLKLTDFSKTGSRDMAETCAMNFFDHGFLFDFCSVEGIYNDSFCPF